MFCSCDRSDRVRKWVSVFRKLFAALSERPQLGYVHITAAEDTVTFNSVDLSSSYAILHNYSPCTEMHKCHDTCQSAHLPAQSSTRRTAQSDLKTFGICFETKSMQQATRGPSSLTHTSGSLEHWGRGFKLQLGKRYTL